MNVANLPSRTQIPGLYRRRVGGMVVTALSDGVFTTERVMTRNLEPEALAAALNAAFRNALEFSVNAYLVQSQERTTLIDTGSGDYLGPAVGHLARNLAAAGVARDEIDTILLTHMHPDHSAGLSDRQTWARLYPNAELVVHENEPRHWFDDEKMAGASELYKYLHFQMSREQVTPYLDRMRTFSSGEAVPGITAVNANGHTPGHTAYVVESGGERVMIWGDTVHIPEVQFARPEITMVPDTDPDEAVVARRRLMAMAAEERLLVAGMHLHFPGFGHVSRDGDAFRFHPEAWRQSL